MILHDLPETEEEQGQSGESSESLSSKIDDSEETLERKLIKWYAWLQNKDRED